MKKLVVLFMVICIGLFASEGPTQQDVKIAQHAAQGWLHLIDTGEIEESWNEAAGIFKEKVTLGQWEKSITEHRTKLGKVIVRELMGGRFTNGLKGFPAGKYVVIRFDTDFENKKEAIETVIQQMDDQNNWKAVGYYIK